LHALARVNIRRYPHWEGISARSVAWGRLIN
jgi:hypothetical protein